MASFSQRQIEDICEAAAEKACNSVLDHLGIDTANHQDTRRDFEFLRDWRSICEMSKRRGTVVVVTLMVTAVFTLIVSGVTTWILSFR